MEHRIALRAVSGIVSGLSLAALAVGCKGGAGDAKKEPGAAAPDGSAGHAAGDKSKNCCVGKNECKGKGGCKTEANECAGKNECKGKGGCSMRDCK